MPGQIKSTFFVFFCSRKFYVKRQLRFILLINKSNGSATKDIFSASRYETIETSQVDIPGMARPRFSSGDIPWMAIPLTGRKVCIKELDGPGETEYQLDTRKVTS